MVRMPVKVSLPDRGFTASLMVSIPNIRMAKPRKIEPMSLFLWLSFAVIVRITPTAASTGEKDEGFSRRISTLSPEMPARERSQEVIVVPILAPMMMPTDCESCIMPELTKPTTMTVVAEED